MTGGGGGVSISPLPRSASAASSSSADKGLSTPDPESGLKTPTTPNPAIRPADSADWTDVAARTRGQLLRLAAAHAMRVTGLGLLSAVPVVVVITLCVMVQNYVARVYTHRGNDPSEHVSLDTDVQQSLSGSPARLLLAVQVGVLTFAASVWICLWLARIARDTGRRLTAGWCALAALVAVADGLLVGVNAAQDAVVTNPALSFAFTAALFGYLGHLVGTERFFGRLVAVTYVCGTLALFAYLYVVPALFYGAASDRARVALFVVAHPLLVELAVAPSRALARHAPPHATHAIMLWTHIAHTAAGVVGRSLVFGMTSATGTVAMLVALSAMEVVLRVTMVARDALYAAAFSACCRCRRARFSRERARQVRAEVVGAYEITEVSSILVAAASALLYRTVASPGVVLASAAAQLLTELGCDMVPAVGVAMFSPGVSDAVAPLWAFRRAHLNIERAAIVWRSKSWRRTLRDLAFGALTWTGYTVAAAHAPFSQFCVREGVGGAGTGWWNEWRSCWVS